MTAVLGILNKQAVAIAADSAVTIGGPNNHKIFNRANKVFALSKRHPVGIMLYNSASFMTTPWETIIKVYRKHLGDNSFPTVKGYQENFIEFLRLKGFFTDADLQKLFLRNFLSNIIDSVINEIIKNNRSIVDNPTEDNKREFLVLFEQRVDNLVQIWANQPKTCPEFVDYTFEMFNPYSEDLFVDLIQSKFIQNAIQISPEIIAKVKELAFSILKSDEVFTSFTGLIFTGFGEEEIYPQLIPINISMVVDNRLRYYIDFNHAASISNSLNGAVRPFAQTDVIDTILSGIDPSLDTTYTTNFGALFNKYNREILTILGDSNPLLSAQIQALNTEQIVAEYARMNKQIKSENYISPLMNAVSNLSKEDLAEMAESLIYLTYLKRRITNAEESVGGPVDVAIISKGDGFIWIKRKHYFKPELNQYFFDNYFKT
jgi:hypothetical protein